MRGERERKKSLQSQESRLDIKAPPDEQHTIAVSHGSSPPSYGNRHTTALTV